MQSVSLVSSHSSRTPLSLQSVTGFSSHTSSTPLALQSAAAGDLAHVEDLVAVAVGLGLVSSHSSSTPFLLQSVPVESSHTSSTLLALQSDALVSSHSSSTPFELQSVARQTRSGRGYGSRRSRSRSSARTHPERRSRRSRSPASARTRRARGWRCSRPPLVISHTSRTRLPLQSLSLVSSHRHADLQVNEGPCRGCRQRVAHVEHAVRVAIGRAGQLARRPDAVRKLQSVLARQLEAVEE